MALQGSADQESLASQDTSPQFFAIHTAKFNDDGVAMNSEDEEVSIASGSLSGWLASDLPSLKSQSLGSDCHNHLDDFIRLAPTIRGVEIPISFASSTSKTSYPD